MFFDQVVNNGMNVFHTFWSWSSEAYFVRINNEFGRNTFYIRFIDILYTSFCGRKRKESWLKLDLLGMFQCVFGWNSLRQRVEIVFGEWLVIFLGFEEKTDFILKDFSAHYWHFSCLSSGIIRIHFQLLTLLFLQVETLTYMNEAPLIVYTQRFKNQVDRSEQQQEKQLGISEISVANFRTRNWCSARSTLKLNLVSSLEHIWCWNNMRFIKV